MAETKAGKPVRQIAEELGAEIHRQTPLLPLDFFQKNCGLLVKQSLKHEGLGRNCPECQGDRSMFGLTSAAMRLPKMDQSLPA